MTGAEQVLVEDWCAQYQTHSVGTVAFGADGASLRERRRRAPERPSPTGDRREPAEPVRRPAGRSRGDAHSAVGRGWLAAKPGSAHVVAIPAGSTERSSASIRRPEPGVARQPLRRQLRPERPSRSSPTACATRSASPSVLGRVSPGSADVGGIDWEEINRIPSRPDARGRELRLAVLRGCGDPNRASTRPNFTICENLYAQPGAVTGAVLTPTTTPRRSSLARAVPQDPRRSRAWPSSLLPRRACSRRLTRARSSSPTTRETASGR